MFVIPGDVGFCNAVRRTILSDVTTWAPHELKIHKNTSGYTDEFLAHRIGLIPFRRVGKGDTMALVVEGPATCVASDIVGPHFDAVHPNLEIARLAAGQSLDLRVHFNNKPASTHARYAVCAGVGMERIDAERYRITFETIDGRPPVEVMRESLDALERRIDRALHELAHQPSEPPRSMC